MATVRRAISVILADDEPDIVEYLRIMLHLEGFTVLGTAADATGAASLVETLRPDVALLDLGMPGSGLAAALRIRAANPDTHIVIFSAATAAIGILPLVSAGIDGYVVKGAPPARLAEAIRNAVEGRVYLAPEASKVAIDELAARLQAEERTALQRIRRRDRIIDVIEGVRFHLVHQPIIDLRVSEPHGVEALTRFNALPQRSPDLWFDEAEQVGERTSLELATARTALQSLDHLLPDLYMTINISPATALSGRLGEILDDTDLHRVVLEVTEHSPVTDYPTLTAALQPWRERGARLAVDDAGGGYASFAHILNLSPDFIKLDISLVHQIDTDPQRQALARAICGFANELGVTVIAEGIETAAELEVVFALGTPLAQGFHLGRPRGLADQPELLKDASVTSLAAPRRVTQIDLRDDTAGSERARSWLRPKPADADSRQATVTTTNVAS